MILRALLFAVLPLVASSAQAGWVSGGGELIKNKNNPWFIQNTETVGYCIEKDDATFRLSPQRLDELIHDALDYWRAEFRRAAVSSAGTPSMSLLTQTLVKRPCSEAVDLRFQFGVLSPEQRAGLGGVDPREHVAFVIRTEYDERQLKGRGFLYVTPDNGPERYRGDDYRDGVWHEANGRHLFEILVHELGHVFGLPHFGMEFMAESFGEWLVQYPRPIPAEGQPETATLSFNYGVPRQRCQLDAYETAKLREFFEIQEDFSCVGFEFAPGPDFNPATARLSYRVNGVWRSAATIEFKSWKIDSHPNIKLKFRAEQQVFAVDGPGTAFALPSAVTEASGWSTTDRSQTRKYVSFEFEPTTFKVSGLYPDVGLRHLLFYAWNYETPR